jgi:SAM-dependent methyltransferase
VGESYEAVRRKPSAVSRIMHDSWARYYDFIYDQCFGDVFQHITEETLALIRRVQAAPARILDLGAGTGRLAIPLAREGYAITAIDASEGMADVLASRARSYGLLRTDWRCTALHDSTLRSPGDERLTADEGPSRPEAACPHLAATQAGGIDLRRAEFSALGDVLASGAPQVSAPHDLAIAIFTVLNYVVDEADARRLALHVAAALRPGGRLIFDLAGRKLFAPALFENERLHREIDVDPIGPRIFLYTDSGCGTFDGEERFEYTETFTMRYWRDEEVLAVFADAGLRFAAEVTSPLRATGSRWFVLEKCGCES